MEPNHYKHHYFSHELAKVYGVEAAIILRFLTDEARRQHLDYGDHFHCVLMPAEIFKTLPYIRRRTIERLLRDLSGKGAIKIKAVNAPSSPSPSSYQIPYNIAKTAGKFSIRLDVVVAIKMGIPSAIVLEEIRYRITLALRKTTKPFVGSKIKRLSSLLPYSTETLTAALEPLKAAKMIIPHPKLSDRFRLPTTDPVVAKYHHPQSNINIPNVA